MSLRLPGLLRQILPSVHIRMASSSSSPPLKLADAGLWKTQAYINGSWVSGSSTFAVTDPGTGKEIGSCPELGVEETKQAIKHAYAALKEFRKTTPYERAAMLRKLFELMTTATDDLGSIVTLENGKPLKDGKGEVTYGASFIDWFAGEAIRMYGDVIPSPVASQRNVVIRQGIGVCGILTPWNFPNAMITRKLGAALAAGCPVVIKAPAETPFSALAIAELCERAGYPKGVVNVITTSKNTAAVGKEMCENDLVKKITFTGSTRVGKILASQSSSTLKKLSMELGGNAPFIVFDDADLDKAVEGAIVCKFRSSGQTCVCANRIFVQSDIYSEFASRLAEKVDAFKVGNGFDDGVTHGPLIHAQAVDKVERHVKDAKSKGAQVLIGGQKMQGNFYAPTILTDVPREAEVNDEETFGPVAALIKFESEADVIEMANDTDVGLAAYLYSRDIGRVWRVAEAIEAGMIGCNTGLISQAAIPFGGVKQSGFGREGSKYGIEDYTTLKFMAFGGLSD